LIQLLNIDSSQNNKYWCSTENSKTFSWYSRPSGSHLILCILTSLYTALQNELQGDQSQVPQTTESSFHVSDLRKYRGNTALTGYNFYSEFV
jgi:hypothetical protein